MRNHRQNTLESHGNYLKSPWIHKECWITPSQAAPSSLPNNRPFKTLPIRGPVASWCACRPDLDRPILFTKNGGKKTGWWFGTCFYFSIDWVSNHPNIDELISFRGVETKPTRKCCKHVTLKWSQLWDGPPNICKLYKRYGCSRYKHHSC